MGKVYFCWGKGNEIMKVDEQLIVCMVVVVILAGLLLFYHQYQWDVYNECVVRGSFYCNDIKPMI